MGRDTLGVGEDALRRQGGHHTAREISGQPELWKKTWDLIAENRSALRSFLETPFEHSGLQVVLTGAGTSAFIGEVAEPLLRRRWHSAAEAIHTTTLVTHFRDYIDPDRPLLLISFARSGNSPESTASVRMAETYCKREVYHLVITCNADGELARISSELNSFRLLMPPEAEDRSLAMTGSFTSMLLAVLLVGGLDQSQALQRPVNELATCADHFFENGLETVRKVASRPFQRAVFLGSGPRLGMAREGHLKLQELTDGAVICKYDSFLGFRHGPKAVIDDQTLLVYLFSEDPQVLQYERDLVEGIRDKGFGMASLGVFADAETEIETDFRVDFGNRGSTPASFLGPLLSILPAQALGFYASLQQGLNPDEPSASGAIARVVEGVTIYPITDGGKDA